MKNYVYRLKVSQLYTTVLRLFYLITRISIKFHKRSIHKSIEKKERKIGLFATGTRAHKNIRVIRK